VTLRLFFRRYWRIFLVALLGALVAFAASFAVTPTYTSSTRMLIQGRSTSLLSSTGTPLQSQPGINEVDAAKTLSQTEAGLVSSREVATMVVDQLHLDAPKPAKHGPIHWLEGAAASTYAHVRAWITSGFYKQPARREKAIQTTQAGIKGSDVAPSGGADTGQPDSYILDISASAETAAQARAIANAAADSLMTISQQRFTADSKSYAAQLGAQLTNAKAALLADNKAVAAYEAAHGITSLDQQLVQQVQNQGTLQGQVVAANAKVKGDQQTVGSLQGTLAAIDPNTTSQQGITTGRSETNIDTTAANPVYQDVQQQLVTAQATLQADQATAASLQQQLDAKPSDSLNVAQAQLLSLEQAVTADNANVQTLAAGLSQANANIQVSPIDLNRVGDADLPTYPTSPKRYLYLLLGLLIGALAGGGLTYLARRRALSGEGGGDDDDTVDPDQLRTSELDLRDEPLPQREPVPVGARAGNGGGNGTPGNGNGNGSPGNGNGSPGNGSPFNEGTADNGTPSVFARASDHAVDGIDGPDDVEEPRSS
jgi:uncharacterized protein involved in exopolysaccharide biosynthesis